MTGWWCNNHLGKKKNIFETTNQSKLTVRPCHSGLEDFCETKNFGDFQGRTVKKTRGIQRVICGNSSFEAMAHSANSLIDRKQRFGDFPLRKL